MSSPYINTELYANVSLVALQMENRTNLNLKNNLVKSLEKKCYKNYGYIMEIYKIIKKNDGYISAEDMSSSANFDLTFSCRLCVPMSGTEIICQVNRVNKMLITVMNGPILIIITNDKINNKVFFIDNNNNLKYRNGDKSESLNQNEFVKVTITSVIFNNGDDKIKAIGFLNDVANEKETEQYYTDLYNTEMKFIDVKKHMEETNPVPVNFDKDNKDVIPLEQVDKK
jgi:DNA-directed RNA polymerase subunit E'/Rpb7